MENPGFGSPGMNSLVSNISGLSLLLHLICESELRCLKSHPSNLTGTMFERDISQVSQHASQSKFKHLFKHC